MSGPFVYILGFVGVSSGAVVLGGALDLTWLLYPWTTWLAGTPGAAKNVGGLATRLHAPGYKHVGRRRRGSAGLFWGKVYFEERGRFVRVHHFVILLLLFLHSSPVFLFPSMGGQGCKIKYRHV